VIRQYPFPIIEGEKFITEAYVYDQIDQSYIYYLLPNIMIVCEYRDDGLTRNIQKINFENPCGYTAYYIQRANYSKTLIGKVKNFIRANCYRYKIKGIKLPVKPQNRTLFNLTYPAGLILFFLKNYINK